MNLDSAACKINEGIEFYNMCRILRSDLTNAEILLKNNHFRFSKDMEEHLEKKMVEFKERVDIIKREAEINYPHVKLITDIKLEIMDDLERFRRTYNFN